MAEVSKKQRRRAQVAALITTVFVALFAMAFVGLVLILDDYADSLEADNDISINVAAPRSPFYVLLIGSDSRKGTALYTGNANEHAQLDQHSDIMTLMRVDPLTYTITLVTVPRDTVLEGHTEKINDSLLTNDPARVVEAVGELTSIHADHYMMTNFISFENLINALGGIDVDVPETVTVPDPSTGKNVTVKAGQGRHLDGAQALVLARARKQYNDNQDALRQVLVRDIERAMIQKVLAMGDGVDVEHILAALEDDTKTDLDLPTAGFLILQFIEHADEVKIYDGTGTYVGANRASDGLWVIPDDEMAWESLMAVVDAGEDPAAVIKEPEFGSSQPSEQPSEPSA